MKRNIKIILRGMPQVDRACEIIRMLPLEPLMVVTIAQHKDSKSLAQLRTVHMWLREVQDFFQEAHGKYYHLDALKEHFKGLFGVVEVMEAPSGNKTIVKSFADYTVDEMSQFMDDMNHYCGSELHLFLTLPGIDESI